MEANRAAFGAVADEVLDETESRVAGVSGADGIQLHDRPLVARCVALHPQQPREAALVLVDEEQVVGAEGAERQSEETEDADAWTAYGQAERPRVDMLLLG